MYRHHLLPETTLGRSNTPHIQACPKLRRIRTLQGLLLVALLLLPISPGASPARGKRAKSTRELRRDLSGIRSQIRETKAQIRETKRREIRITDEIDAVEARLLRAESRLAAVKDRLAYLATEREILVNRIAETEKRLNVRRQLLGKRLRDNYIRGNVSYIEVLLRSRSMHDYLSRSYYVERIVESDIELVRGIKADQRQLIQDKLRLEVQAAEQKRLRVELEAQAAEYRASVELKRGLLHEVRESRENMEEALDELEETSRQIEARIRALQQTPRGRARLLRPWTGSFGSPADGPITSGYGMRFHPILRRYRMHTGVDIGAGYGSPIRAAANGEVILAGHMRGYGNTVIVDHGGGVSTLYAHCSDILVSEGQNVQKGQTIARVGSTGLATGPHLHFEVRHNGTPVNPR